MNPLINSFTVQLGQGTPIVPVDPRVKRSVELEQQLIGAYVPQKTIPLSLRGYFGAIYLASGQTGFIQTQLEWLQAAVFLRDMDGINKPTARKALIDSFPMTPNGSIDPQAKRKIPSFQSTPIGSWSFTDMFRFLRLDWKVTSPELDEVLKLVHNPSTPAGLTASLVSRFELDWRTVPPKARFNLKIYEALLNSTNMPCERVLLDIPILMAKGLFKDELLLGAVARQLSVSRVDPFMAIKTLRIENLPDTIKTAIESSFKLQKVPSGTRVQCIIELPLTGRSLDKAAVLIKSLPEGSVVLIGNRDVTKELAGKTILEASEVLKGIQEQSSRRKRATQQLKSIPVLQLVAKLALGHRLSSKGKEKSITVGLSYSPLKEFAPADNHLDFNGVNSRVFAPLRSFFGVSK